MWARLARSSGIACRKLCRTTRCDICRCTQALLRRTRRLHRLWTSACHGVGGQGRRAHWPQDHWCVTTQPHAVSTSHFSLSSPAYLQDLCSLCRHIWQPAQLYACAGHGSHVAMLHATRTSSRVQAIFAVDEYVHALGVHVLVHV